MTFERGVHETVELGELTRVGADQVGPQLLDAGADAVGIGGEVEGAERADLAVAREPRVGFDADHRGVEDGDGLAAGPLVRGFVEWEGGVVGEDAGDAHGVWCVWRAGWPSRASGQGYGLGGGASSGGAVRGQREPATWGRLARASSAWPGAGAA